MWGMALIVKMQMMNWIFRVVFLISLLFLGIYLYRFEYLSMPRIRYPSLLWGSIPLLFSGFLTNAVNWQQALRAYGLHIPYRLAIVSNGLSIFTKYVPGKVMVILGRSAFVSTQCDEPLKTTASASMLAQIVAIWSGLLLGSVVMISTSVPTEWLIGGAIAIVVLTLGILFLNRITLLANGLGEFFNLSLDLRMVALNEHPSLPISFFVNWVLWSVGFVLLTASVVGLDSFSLGLLFVFPLATTTGIIALFAPGGLGVREGVLVGCMTLYGIPLDEATGIAILSRLWFLAGEGFIFLLALALRR